MTTNALGQAAATALTPTGAGAVRINVAAAFQGQTAGSTGSFFTLTQNGTTVTGTFTQRAPVKVPAWPSVS